VEVPGVAEEEGAVEPGEVDVSQFSQAARVIVFRGDQLLIMQRNNHGKRYRTLIGGGIEPNESEEQAALRETFEEASITVADAKKIFTEIIPARKQIQHIFLCRYLSGEPKLAEDSEERLSNHHGQNIYEPLWMDIYKIANELGDHPFITERLFSEILLLKENGFQQAPKEWTI